MVEVGKITLREAGERIGVSYRQAKRIGRAIRERGIKGLVHGNRGRPSNNRQSRFKGVRVYRSLFFGDLILPLYLSCFDKCLSLSFQVVLLDRSDKGISRINHISYIEPSYLGEQLISFPTRVAKFLYPKN